MTSMCEHHWRRCHTSLRRLLIDAEDESAVGWVEIESDNVTHLVRKQRIGGELEGFGPMLLQAEGARCGRRSKSRCRCAAPCCACSNASLRAAGSPASAR